MKNHQALFKDATKPLKNMIHFFFLSLFLLTTTTIYSQAELQQQSLERSAVTVGNYLDFLKAAASSQDPHGLYSSVMASQITQSKWRENSYYFVSNGASADQMMICCNPMQERRYCNWIVNGAPKKREEAEKSTETGAYDLTGTEVIFNPEATCYLYDAEGMAFLIVMKVDAASPLMFGYRGSEEKKETKGVNLGATLQRKGESNLSQSISRHDLSSDADAAPVEFDSQPKTRSDEQGLYSKEKIPDQEIEQQPRSWEEKSFLAHWYYFERQRTQAFEALAKEHREQGGEK